MAPPLFDEDTHPIKTGFMNLPRELRDMVYYFALVPRPGHLTRVRYAHTFPRPPGLKAELAKKKELPEQTRAPGVLLNQEPENLPKVALSLFLTSKRIKFEAEEVFYRHSNFAMKIRDYQTYYGVFIWRTGCKYSFVHVKQYFSPFMLSNIRHLSIACAVSDSPIATAAQAVVGRSASSPDPEITQTLCLDKSPRYFDTWLYCTWKQKINFVAAMPSLREIYVRMYDC